MSLKYLQSDSQGYTDKPCLQKGEKRGRGRRERRKGEGHRNMRVVSKMCPESIVKSSKLGEETQTKDLKPT